MTSGIHTLGRLVKLLVSLTLLLGCTAATNPPLLLAPEFTELKIATMVLLPVVFDRRSEPPLPIDLDDELRAQARDALEKKGYEVRLGEEAAQGQTSAALTIRVDFLFISDTYGERHPPPVVDIEAEAWLRTGDNGRQVWRDRGVGRVGGVGRTRIFYPDLARRIALDRLCDSLFDTLPDAPGKQPY